MEHVQKRVAKRALAAIKNLAAALHEDMVSHSPVRTGEFRACNQVSLNSLEERTEAVNPAANADVTLAQGRAVLAGALPGDVIYLYNTAPHAVAVEFGRGGTRDTGPHAVYRGAVGRLREAVGIL